MRQRSIKEAQRELREEFDFFETGRDKIEYIIELGQKLPKLEDQDKTEDAKVRGCQSQVWMHADYNEARDELCFRADSDAIIVRGLIALLMKIYDGAHPAEILEHPLTLFDEIGLGKLLTPGRANGLYAMVTRIKAYAAKNSAA